MGLKGHITEEQCDYIDEYVYENIVVDTSEYRKIIVDARLEFLDYYGLLENVNETDLKEMSKNFSSNALSGLEILTDVEFKGKISKLFDDVNSSDELKRLTNVLFGVYRMKIIPASLNGMTEKDIFDDQNLNQNAIEAYRTIAMGMSVDTAVEFYSRVAEDDYTWTVIGNNVYGF